MIALVNDGAKRLQVISRLAERQVRRFPALDLLLRTVRAYSEDRASLIAAALSYYTLLSLFPLMLFILAISSPFLESESAIRAVGLFINSYLPTSVVVIRSSLEEVARLRGPLTIFASLGFIWSASGVFDLLQLGLNRAFCVQRPRPLWRQRIVSLGMVVMVSLLFGASFLMTTSLRLAVHYRVIEREDPLINFIPGIATVVLGVLVFGMLYRYIPYDPDVRWRNVWLAALLASVLWELAKLGFAWYLTNIALLNLVYGSLGAIIAIMLWGYITAVILLMGAEMAAVRSGARKHGRTGTEWWAAVGPQELSAEGLTPTVDAP